MSSQEVTQVIDSFYGRFVLRDLFGKIVPGFIAMIAFGATVTSFKDVSDYVGKMSLGAWIIAIGAGWLGGFVVQSLGELLGLIVYYPRRKGLFRAFAQTTTPWRDLRGKLSNGGEISQIDFAHIQCGSR
jgi:hypothetical protein